MQDLTPAAAPGTPCGAASPTTTDPRFRLLTSYGYDAWGNVSTKTVSSAVSPGQSGYFAPRTTTSVYDAAYHRTPATIYNPLGQSETRVFDGVKDGYTSIADVNGLSTTYEYDALGRLLRSLAPTEAGTSVETLYAFAPFDSTYPGLSYSVQTNHRIAGTTTEVARR